MRRTRIFKILLQIKYNCGINNNLAKILPKYNYIFYLLFINYFEIFLNFCSECVLMQDPQTVAYFEADT